MNDRNILRQVAGDYFFLSAKPNPASVATDRLDHKQLRT